MKHLYIIVFVFPLIGFGQGWEQTFGGTSEDLGLSVQQTSDGGYIITGYTYSFGDGNRDIYLIKTFEDGNLIWETVFGGEEGDSGRSVQQTYDGGYIICGYTGSFGNGIYNVYLIKTDENGQEEWSQIFGEDSGYSHGQSVQQTYDGGYIITGTIGTDVYLIKTDENGVEEWSQTFGGEYDDRGYSVQQTTDGGYIITGCYIDSIDSFGNGSSDLYLIKTDENGVEEWSQTFGGEDEDEGRLVQQTTDGGYIITGRTESFGNGGRDVWLIKTDENGVEEWSQTFGGGDDDEGHSVQQTVDGGYIITGTTGSFGNGGKDVWLIKTDESGEEEWSQTFGENLTEWGRSVQQTSDGGYIITGGVSSFGNGMLDIYLLKTDGQGNVTSTIELPTLTSKRELLKTTNILGQENTTIKNQPLIEIYDDGSTEKKIVIE